MNIEFTDNTNYLVGNLTFQSKRIQDYDHHRYNRYLDQNKKLLHILKNDKDSVSPRHNTSFSPERDRDQSPRVVKLLNSNKMKNKNENEIKNKHEIIVN